MRYRPALDTTHTRRLVLLAISTVMTFGPVVAADLPNSGRQPAAEARSATLSAGDLARYDEAVNLINVYDGYGDHLQRAYQILAELAQKYPASGYPVVGLAELQYRLAGLGSGSYPEALRLARQAVQMDRKIAGSYIIAAKVFLKQNNLHLAELNVGHALRLAPGRPEPLLAKARLEEAKKQYDDAERSYRSAIKAFKDDQRKSNTYFWLGEMFKNKKPPDLAKAADAYGKSAELSGASPWKLNNIATFFTENTYEYDRAIAYLERGLKYGNLGALRTNLAIARYSKWAYYYLNPGKNKTGRPNSDTPEKITADTGVTAELIFAKAPLIKTYPWVTPALLKLGLVTNVDVMPPDAEMTALTAASYGNRLDIVKLLAERGANVNAEDRQSRQTPIFYAVMNGNLDMVKYLFEKGARINLVDGNRAPLLFYSMSPEAGAQGSKILQYLIEQGADPTVLDHVGNPLIVVAVMQGRPDAVRLLIEKYQADPNAKSSNGQPVLTTAAVSGGTAGKEIVEFLLKAGANPWVKYGPGDVLNTLRRKGINTAIFPSFPENARMIEEARTRFPRPADFDVRPQALTN